MGGSSGQQQNQTVETTPWRGQVPYLEQLFTQAQDRFNQPAPDITASTELAQGAVSGLTNAAEGLGDFLGNAQGANEFLLGDVLRPDSNPALQEYINLSNSAITRQFTEGILPQLTSGAVQAGNIGSARQGLAEGQAAGRTIDAVERNTAGLASQGYGQGLQAMLQGLGLVPRTAAAQGLPSEFLLAASQAQRAVEGSEESQFNQRLNNYQQIIDGNYGRNQVSTGSVTGGNNTATQALGIGLSAYALYSNPYTATAGALYSVAAGGNAGGLF